MLDLPALKVYMMYQVKTEETTADGVETQK
jgi:hypothetical protein